MTDTNLLPSGHGWIPLPAGESRAAVFRRDDGAMFAKCVTPEEIAELEDERHRISWLTETGIPGPSVVDWCSAEHGACLVLTAVPGVPATELSSGALLRAWPSMVRMLRRIHELPVRDCPFDRTLPSMFRIASDIVRRDAVNPDFLSEEQRGVPVTSLLADLRSELDRRVAQEADDLVVCHGDACLPNFMIDPDALTCTGVIDLGRLGIADRHADLALLRANARETWSGDDEASADRILTHSYGHDRLDDERLRFYLHLDPLTWT